MSPESEQVTSGYPTEQDVEFEKNLRPNSFPQFIGQDKVTENLQIYIQAAQDRNESVDHILFSGPPGLGKTTLARLVSIEAETNFHQTSGPIVERAGDLAGVLTDLEFGDVLFIDEIHRLPRDVEEYLYSAMEDYKISIILDQGPHARSVSLDLPPFTLIGATTREGLLTGALRSRFGVREKLNYYPPEDLANIIRRSAKLLEVEIHQEAAHIIAKRARGTPRIANRFLRRIRDLAQIESDNVITEEVARDGLERLRVDEHGLNDVDRAILETLLDHKGGPCGVKTICATIGEEKRTIEEVHEPFLIRLGLLKKTSRGRMLTEAGFQHLDASNSHPDAQKTFESEQ